jgi:biopolymer transport protein ExbB
MSFNLAHIFQSMSPLSKGIFVVLLVMAILSIGVTIERWLAFRKSVVDSLTFAKKIDPMLDRWEIDEVAEVARTYKSSHLARLFAPTIDRYIRAHESLGGGLSPVELARNEADRRKEQISAELRRGMSIVATVGSIAPFVGLLGTVVGIIAAFQGIGASGSGGIAAVSSGIAEALVETAFGLMVAIPAVIMFNWLTARVAILELAIARAGGELLDEMESHLGNSASSRSESAQAAAE